MGCLNMGETAVTFLGTRGTIPVTGEEFSVYGGATSCVLVHMASEYILLDAGTGLMRAGEFIPKGADRVSILLTHAHIDHILGLSSFLELYDASRAFEIMAFAHGGLGARAQVEQMMRPPIWPIGPESFSGRVKFTDIEHSRFNIGGVEVDAANGSHPGGCTMFRLSHAGKSIVFCTDFEHGGDAEIRLVKFAKDASLLIFDGQYSDEEYASRRGWGHSTWNKGVEIAKLCGAKRLVLVHHDPARMDSQLRQIEDELHTKWQGCSFAKFEQRIVL